MNIICKDKLGDQLQIISKPFENKDKTYVVTQDKNKNMQLKILENLIFEDGVPTALLDPEYVESLIPESEYVDLNDYPHIVPYEYCKLKGSEEEYLIVSYPYYIINTKTIVINVRDKQQNLLTYPINDLVFKCTFKTGAQRSSDVNQYRFDLISPFALRALAMACAEGASKYPMFNAEKGLPIHDLLNHSINHIYEYLAGDRQHNELGKALWGLAMSIHSEAMWPHLNEGTLRKEGCFPPDNPDGLYWKDLKK